MRIKKVHRSASRGGQNPNCPEYKFRGRLQKARKSRSPVTGFTSIGLYHFVLGTSALPLPEIRTARVVPFIGTSYAQILELQSEAMPIFPPARECGYHD